MITPRERNFVSGVVFLIMVIASFDNPLIVLTIISHR
jgi:hypothetical protein